MEQWLKATEVHVPLHPLQVYIDEAAYWLTKYFHTLDLTFEAASAEVSTAVKPLYSRPVRTTFSISAACMFLLSKYNI